MKTMKTTRKLTLNKEVISNLRNVKGGTKTKSAMGGADTCNDSLDNCASKDVCGSGMFHCITTVPNQTNG